MCCLEMPPSTERYADLEANGGLEGEQEITMYQMSEGHNMLATVTDRQSVYVYSLHEMRSKFFQKQQRLERQERESMNILKEH